MDCNKELMMTWQSFFTFISILWLISLKPMSNLFLGSFVCLRQEWIKFFVCVVSLGRTENGGRCPSTVIENRTGGRKRRRNDHPSVSFVCFSPRWGILLAEE
jgi:polyferredoxin